MGINADEEKVLRQRKSKKGSSDQNLHRLSKLHESQYFGDISVLLKKPEPAVIRVSSLKAVLWRIHKSNVPKLSPSVVEMMKKNAVVKMNWRIRETHKLQKKESDKMGILTLDDQQDIMGTQTKKVKLDRRLLEKLNATSRHATWATPSWNGDHPVEYLPQFKELQKKYLQKKKRKEAKAARVRKGTWEMPQFKEHRNYDLQEKKRKEQRQKLRELGLGMRGSPTIYSPRTTSKPPKYKKLLGTTALSYL